MATQSRPGAAARPTADSGGIDTAAPASPHRLAGLTHGHAKREALQAFRAIKAGTLAARLLELYARAGRGELLDRAGRAWPGLTDYEAAAMLGAERTSINAARNPLLRAGLVDRGASRKCRHKPSRFDVVAWTITDLGREAVDTEAGPDRHRSTAAGEASR